MIDVVDDAMDGSRKPADQTFDAGRDSLEHRLYIVGELAMTFNISAVAACCSRASFRSLLGSEIERGLTRVAAAAMRALVLVVLRPFAGLALRDFASLFLPPVLAGRAISALGFVGSNSIAGS